MRNQFLRRPPLEGLLRCICSIADEIARVSLPLGLFSPATAKRRGRIASLNWRIENNRAIPPRSEGGGVREWRTKTRGAMGRVGEREQAGTANARLTEAVSLRFIAARLTTRGEKRLRADRSFALPSPTALRGPSAERPRLLSSSS